MKEWNRKLLSKAKIEMMNENEIFYLALSASHINREEKE
jgi:hypothetical protein